MTKDDGAYYLSKYEQYNPADGSSGSPDVKRLAFGSKTLIVGPKLYWVDSVVGAWSLRSIDASGATTTLLLPEGSLIQRVLDGYVYFTPTSGDELDRVALSDAKTP
jgi:hypothetical protein